MSIDEGQITRLVEEVVDKLRRDGSLSVPPHERSKNGEAPSTISHASTSGGASSPRDGIFASIDEATVAAQAAYLEFRKESLESRKKVIDSMRRAAKESCEILAREAVSETGLGKVAHKVQKVLLAATKTPGVEDLEPFAYTGDDGLTLVEPAPYGVVGCITPTTNPAPTVINNGISAVAAGNAVVFNPHPSAKGVSNLCVSILNDAICKAGGPRTLLCSVREPSLDSSQALMKHPGIKMLVVTGGGAVVKLAMASDKKCIAAGPGNPPVIVDDTADISKAARCIVDGATFDNNVLCTAEKEVFVFDNVADRLLEEMQARGAHLVADRHLSLLAELLVEESEPFPYGPGRYPHPNKDYVGKDASVLLEAGGIEAPRDTCLIICETPYEHPFVHAEMLMPILPIVRARDLEHALEMAIGAEHGFRHSAVMHSESVSNLTRVAREIETTIFTKNAPSYAGLGFGGEGFATLSIAGPTGEGLTSARNYTRQRRCVLSGGFRII